MKRNARQRMRGGALVVVFALWMSPTAADESALTPIGAERAGNASGTIPPWTGGITHRRRTTIRRNTRPIRIRTIRSCYTIDGHNAAQYANELSEGQRALLAAFPDSWRMNVYPTRRSASYPDFVYAAVIANAETAQLAEGNGGVRNSRVSSPFPQPKNGLEAIWNHNLRWRGQRVERAEGSRGGNCARAYTSWCVTLQDLAFAYGLAGLPAGGSLRTCCSRSRAIVLPAQLTGQGTLALEPIDQTRDPRKVWLYLPSSRRMVRAPNYGYASPAPYTDGCARSTSSIVFRPDRSFEWTLVGKREMVIPYNAYRVHGDGVRGARHCRRAPRRIRTAALRNSPRVGGRGPFEARRQTHLRPARVLSR